MNWKQYLIWLGIVAVLLVLLAGSVALKARFGTNTNTNTSAVNATPGSDVVKSDNTGVQNSLGHYENSNLGLQFDYDKTWGMITTIPRKAGDDPGIDSGKLVEVSFANSEDVYFQAFTKDLEGMYVDQGIDEPDVSTLCNNVKQEATKGEVDFEDCKVFTFGTQKYAWVNKLHAPECSPDFLSYIYAINPNNEYRNVQLTIRLGDADQEVVNPYDCTSADGNKESQRQAKIWSDKIFNDGKGLSAEDSNTMAQAKIILNTLKFTK